MGFSALGLSFIFKLLGRDGSAGPGLGLFSDPQWVVLVTQGPPPGGSLLNVAVIMGVISPYRASSHLLPPPLPSPPLRTGREEPSKSPRSAFGP